MPNSARKAARRLSHGGKVGTGKWHRAFRFDAAAEFAVEVDPRGVDDDGIAALAGAGCSRVSIGVQDFNVDVQRAINREQSFEVTARAVGRFRAAGVRSINIDLVYGLPHQTRDSMEATIALVLKLAPDRIALFGYAHLPARLPHQRLIAEAALAAVRCELAMAALRGINRWPESDSCGVMR